MVIQLAIFRHIGLIISANPITYLGNHAAYVMI